MLGYALTGQSEVGVMPENIKAGRIVPREDVPAQQMAGAPTGAVTLARTYATCSHSLMTASNPAANAAAAAVPAFVIVKTGGPG